MPLLKARQILPYMEATLWASSYLDIRIAVGCYTSSTVSRLAMAVGLSHSPSKASHQSLPATVPIFHL